MTFVHAKNALACLSPPPPCHEEQASIVRQPLVFDNGDAGHWEGLTFFSSVYRKTERVNRVHVAQRRSLSEPAYSAEFIV